MFKNSFVTFVNKKNWNRTKNIGYGKENDYLVTLYQGIRYKLFILPLPGIKSEEKETVLNFLSTKKKAFGLKRFSFDNTVLIFKVKEPYVTIKIEKIESILHSITQFLKDHQISLGKYCFICGKNNSDKLVTVTNIEYYSHETCYNNLLAEVEQELKDKKEKKKEKK